MVDDIERIVARRVGHTLSPWQALAVQLTTLLVVFVLFVLFITSGLFLALVQSFAHLLASQLHLPGATPPP